MTCLARLTAPLWRQTTPIDAALVVQYPPSSRSPFDSSTPIGSLAPGPDVPGSSLSGSACRLRQRLRGRADATPPSRGPMPAFRCDEAAWRVL